MPTKLALRLIPVSRDRASALNYLLLAAVLSLALPWRGIAQAATFTVNDLNDAVDANPSDGMCATATGSCTLRAAIQQANALGGGPAGAHIINLPAGTYKLTIGGPGEDDAATGDLDIKTDVTIAGSGEIKPIVDAGGIDRAFDVFAGSTATIRDLTIINGHIAQNTEKGGAVQNNGHLTLDSVNVQESEAGKSATQSPYLEGGGVFNGLEGTLTIINSAISKNIAYGAHAGGIYNLGSLSISGSTISANQAASWGGGIYNGNASSAEIGSTTISGNRSFHGAGITLDG
jgi:CSLREA domain-containing protein